MAARPISKREEEFVEKVAPPSYLSQLRPSIRKEVSEGLTQQQAAAQRMMTSAFKGFDRSMVNDQDLERKTSWNDCSMKSLLGKPRLDVFKNCKVQYAHDQRQDVYSVRTVLDNRPRILTLRLGKTSTELSLADQNGNVLETVEQKDGRGIRFSVA